MNLYLHSVNQNKRDWILLTPAEWIIGGFEIRFGECRARVRDSEIDELIEKRWEEIKGTVAWRKTGFRSLEFDLEKRVLTICVENDDWKAYQGTNLNPDFYRAMLSRFNRAHSANLQEWDMVNSLEFLLFAMKYSANILAQCHAVITPDGIPIGMRSGVVGVEQGVWHVPGGYFQEVGGGIYKADVPVHNGIPVTSIDRFGVNPESVGLSHLKANAVCNLYDESGGACVLSDGDIFYTGLVWELTANVNNVELIGMARSGVPFGKDWEHEQMLHIPLNKLPEFASLHDMVA